MNVICIFSHLAETVYFDIIPVLVANSLSADTLNLVYIHTICDTWAGCTAGQWQNVKSVIKFLSYVGTL